MSTKSSAAATATVHMCRWRGDFFPGRLANMPRNCSQESATSHPRFDKYAQPLQARLNRPASYQHSKTNEAIMLHVLAMHCSTCCHSAGTNQNGFKTRAWILCCAAPIPDLYNATRFTRTSESREASPIPSCCNAWLGAASRSLQQSDSAGYITPAEIMHATACNKSILTALLRSLGHVIMLIVILGELPDHHRHIGA